MKFSKIHFSSEKCWRIIPSLFPPINLFERVADSKDLENIFAIEALTNDRLRQEVGNLSLIPEEDRISGSNTSYIMSAFTHLNPSGSRFSDGSWGVYYASFQLETAISETKYHRENFLKSTNEDPIRLDMRVLTATLKGTLEDIVNSTQTEILYHPTDYTHSQQFAREAKQENLEGIYYRSVRAPNGTNIAAFKPKILSNCLQERHLEYIWDGTKISAIFEKKMFKTA